MCNQKTTAELLARAIKVCNKTCDYLNTYYSRRDCVSDLVSLARTCKEVLEVFLSVIEYNSKDDPVFASVERIVLKCDYDVRELEKRLKEINHSNQKWPRLKLHSIFRRKDLVTIKSNLQNLRDNLGVAKKVTTITVEKCEQRTVKTPLHDETDDVTESPPPRYTRYDTRPSTMYSTKSTSPETLDREYVDSDAQYPAPAYRSHLKTANGANFRLHREADFPHEEYNAMACPWDMGCRPPFYEETFSTRPIGVCIAMNYRNRAAPRAPLFVAIPRGVQVGLYLSPY